ncbi:hypothetical protein D3C72_668950 [compost metagenome]
MPAGQGPWPSFHGPRTLSPPPSDMLKARFWKRGSPGRAAGGKFWGIALSAAVNIWKWATSRVMRKVRVSCTPGSSVNCLRRS